MAGKKRIGFKNRYRHQTGSGVPKRWPVTSGCTAWRDIRRSWYSVRH